MIKPYLLALATLALTACGAQQNNDQSNSNWAHWTGPTLNGTPQARIELLKQRFSTDADRVRICVESGKQHMTDAEIVLESKLAYASWLAAASNTASEDFTKLYFFTQDKCSRTATAFESLVKLADLTKEEPADKMRSTFPQPEMECTSNRCRYGLTLGLGGPGTLSYMRSLDPPNRWSQISTRRPGFSMLSPFVDWISLKQYVEAAKKIPSAAKQEVVAKYSTLLSKAEPSYAELIELARTLEARQIKIDEDFGFAETRDNFYASRRSSGTIPFTPRMSALHVLLHEVGHQFGMDHADAPGPDSITGGAEQTSENQQVTTEEATMAYGLPYAYLEDDDKAGVRHATDAIRAELATHR